MSRIQNILEKAEREGSVRRIVATPDTIALGSREATATAPAIVEPIAAIAGSAPPGLTPGRIVSGAGLDRRLVAVMTPGAVAAEQYRALRTRILHADNGAPVNVLLITSPGRAEGKTLTAGNLALTMAQDFQRRTCLVDADMRSPQLHRLFGLPDGPGLADVLAGEATLDEALVTLDEYQLSILPAGHLPAHPAELLGTTAMRRTLDTLRSRFDRVVLDAPAATPLADTSILTPLVDSVLLVVRAAVTPKPAIHEAIAALDSSKLLGIVLNETMVID